MPDHPPQFFRANAAGVAPGGHYSHAVAAGGFVFVSGQLPIPPNGVKDATVSIERSLVRSRSAPCVSSNPSVR